MQNTSNQIGYNVAIGGFYESICYFLITTSIDTCVSDALDLNINKQSSNFISKENKGSVETKVLILI